MDKQPQRESKQGAAVPLVPRFFQQRNDIIDVAELCITENFAVCPTVAFCIEMSQISYEYC